MTGEGGERWADRGLVSGEKGEKDEREEQLERCTDSVVTATIDTWCWYDGGVGVLMRWMESDDGGERG